MSEVGILEAHSGLHMLDHPHALKKFRLTILMSLRDHRLIRFSLFITNTSNASALVSHLALMMAFVAEVGHQVLYMIQ